MLADGQDSLLGANMINDSKMKAGSGDLDYAPKVNNEILSPQRSSLKVPPVTKKEKRQEQFTTLLKIFNLILGVVIIAFGVSCYIFFMDALSDNGPVARYIMPGYIALSGFIILLIQFKIKLFVRKMKLLYNYFGRGLFNIFVGIMPLNLMPQINGTQQSTKRVLQIMIYIIACFVCGVGLLYIVAKIFCCAQEEQKKKKKRHTNSGDQSDTD